MGQRHQIIVIYPEMKLNPCDGRPNPNDKPQRAEVIHHQWLYGFNAIFALDRALRLVANSLDGSDPNDRDYLFGRNADGYTSGDGTRAIMAAISVDPERGYYHRAHVWEAADWNGMEGGKRDCGYADPRKLDPEMFDNNDGITVIEFRAGETLPRVCFVTPGHLEGGHWSESDGLGPWTPREYLAFYYNKTQLAKFNEADRALIDGALERIESNSIQLTRLEVLELLPKFKLNKRGSK